MKIMREVVATYPTLIIRNNSVPEKDSAVNLVQQKGKLQKTKRSSLVCTFCKASGHTDKNCWAKMKQEKKRKAEKEVASPASKKKKVESPKKAKPCYICNQVGHLAKDCPLRAELEAIRAKFHKGDSAYMSFTVEETCNVSESIDFGIIRANLEIGFQSLNCIIDSGCKQVLLSEKAFKRMCKMSSLSKTGIKLVEANNSLLTVLGTVKLPVSVKRNTLAFLSQSMKDQSTVNMVKC